MIFPFLQEFHGRRNSFNNVPALLINGDLRAREMSELFSIPLMVKFDSKNFDAWKIYSELDFTKKSGKL